MPDVVALVIARERQARLRGGLRGRAELRLVVRCRDVASAYQPAPIGAALLELRDVDGTPTPPTMRRLRDDFPRTPVIALALPSTPGHELIAAARAGANGLVLQGIEDAGAALTAALEHASDECAARHVLAALASTLTPDAQSILEYCLTQARRALSVDEVADALGINRKTLGRRLVRGGLPGPLALIGWCRLLVAARALENRGRTLEDVALELEFSGAAGLRNMLTRYTGLRPNEVRSRGGFDAVLDALFRALAARAEQRVVDATP